MPYGIRKRGEHDYRVTHAGHSFGHNATRAGAQRQRTAIIMHEHHIPRRPAGASAHAHRRHR